MNIPEKIKSIGKVVNVENVNKIRRVIRVKGSAGVRKVKEIVEGNAKKAAQAVREVTAKKTYSGYSEIPSGDAGGNITEGCIVLEGGAFRGLYTQGFLDEMMLGGINLRCVIGVSAGALGGMNYATGQIGRSARINLGFRHDSRYVGARAFIHSHSILDVSFLTEEADRYEPLKLENLDRYGRRFVAVATNCETGQTEYFEHGKCPDILLACRASATMPFISPAVMMDGVPYFDGGCSCCIPYRWALEQGYGKIIVIRTRERGFRDAEKKYSLAFKLYRDFPEFAKKLSASSRDFNLQCEEIEKLEAEGRLVCCYPSEHVSVGRIEGDLDKLGKLYMLGRKDCASSMDKLKEYL